MSDASSSIPKFAKLLQKEWQDLDGENLADIFWLARQISPSQIAEQSPSTPQNKDDVIVRKSDEIIAPPPPVERDPKVPIALPPPTETKPQQGLSSAVPLQIPAANALRSRLALSRALRPLMQKVPSRTQTVLDEEATAIQTAEQDIWSPVLVPAPERWFDLAIAIEDSPSLELWTDTIAELIELVEQQGAFRQIRTWRLTHELSLSPNWQATADRRSRHSNALKAPNGRQIIWVLSDCTSDLWQQTQIYEILKDWGKYSPLVLVQLLPERLWQRTGLGDGRLMRMPAKYAGATQARLSEDAKPIYSMFAEPELANSTAQTIILPAISIEPEPFRRWAKVTTGNINASIVGIEIDLAKLSSPPEPISDSEPELPLTPEEQIKERVQNFCCTASITAQKLAAYMAAVPVSLPIAHLIQKTLLPESQQIHVAEVFMGGIMERIPNSKPPQYRFIREIREELIVAVPISKTIRVLDTVSAYISERLGKGVKSFQALILLLHELKAEERSEVEHFAEIGLDTLEKLGSEQRAMADRLRQFINTPPVVDTPKQANWPPETQTHNFQIAEIELEELQRFDFETAKIAKVGKSKKKWEITKSAGYGWQRTEELGDEVWLEMVEIIGGTFLMGAPKGEPESNEAETPQHEVMLSDFFISKYPVTQAQWRAVAQLPMVNCELDPDPSAFMGDNRPVERVSWRDAVEFCDRLSAKTGREYRLPTEAEWEYACRAGTTTPFYFGETLSSGLAIYDWDYAYNDGPKGGDRREDPSGTEPVGNFPANAFGLYDMHGNVLEWCLDTWNGSYSKKPEEFKKNGNIPWVSSDKNDENRLLRGGSWGSSPGDCRSAYRDLNHPDIRSSLIGFRVVSSLASTLQHQN